MIARAVALAVPPCLAAVYPLVSLVRSTRASHVFAPLVLIRPAIVLIAAALVLFVGCSRLLANSRDGSVAATIFLTLVGLFPLLFPVPTSLDPVLSVGFVVAIGSVAVAGASWLGRFGLIVSWSAAALVAWVILSALADTGTRRAAWLPVVSGMVGEALASPLAPTSGRRPDIYFIVLDGMGRPDVLERLYGLDSRPALARLQQMGATIPRLSRSNYSQTLLTLASALNLQYLTPLGPIMGDSFDRRPLQQLVAESGVVRLLKREGYEIVTVEAGAGIAPQRFADRCECGPSAAPTEIEYSLISGTPFRGRYLDACGMRAHRQKVLSAFEFIEEASSDQPLLVVAHVLSPHPPFVFSADGSARLETGRFLYHDGDTFPGTREDYLFGYRAQSAFVLDRTVKLLSRVKARSPHALVIVIGDHGPGLGMSSADVMRTDPWERLGILSVYFAGGDRTVVPDDISPVNALRWALRVGLGSGIPLLPNRSYLSSYTRPYRWLEVPE